MKPFRLAAIALALGAGSCAKASPRGSPERAAARLEPPAEGGEPAADAGLSRGAAVEWRGSYHSAAGEVFVPPGWKGVHWTVPATPAGLGDGTVTLKVDGARVSGALDGPLGPATIEGVSSGSTITANVVRVDPDDRGFSGTLVADVGAAAAHGTIHASLAAAGAVRAATFSLDRVR